MNKIIKDENIDAVFQSYSPEIKKKLLFLRELIFKVAGVTEGVGELTEALRWGQPSYLTLSSKSGSMIRIDQITLDKKQSAKQYAMFFHCQTSLVETFKTLFPTQFNFVGHRSIVFDIDDVIPIKELNYCIELALTYYLNKNKG